MKILSIFFFFILFSENAATAFLDRDKFSVSNNSNFDVISPPCILQNHKYFTNSLFKDLANTEINATLNNRKLFKQMARKSSKRHEAYNLPFSLKQYNLQLQLFLLVLYDTF